MAKSKYWRPESVLVLIYTQEGDVLLLERQNPRAHWQSVTGSLYWQENPAQAAQRELFEETGLEGTALIDSQESNAFSIWEQARQFYEPGVSENLEHLFRLELSSKPCIKINLAEHRQYLWLDKQAAVEKVFSWTNRDAILKFVPES